jgi:HPt (histidine-containing phosphotransfer) domain-containing protein
MIHLNHLRPLSKSENANLSSDILDRELPKVESQENKVFTPATEVAPIIKDPYDESPQEELLKIDESFQNTSPILTEESTHSSTPVIQKIELPSTEPLEVNELSLDVFEEEAPQAENLSIPTTHTEEVIQEEWDNGYQYDPHIASKELGLPLDLIEEFIQDFIAQAKEFKPEIYTAIEEGDVDNVKILSHKLKGVAANLRIEDAHEILSTVSATSDMEVIHENLDTFYKIVAKLAGESTQESTTRKKVEEQEPLDLDIIEDNDDFLSLDFKDDDSEQPTIATEEELLTIEDNDVPDKIEMPELADDDFLEFETEEVEPITLEPKKIEIEEIEPENKKLNFSKSDAAKEIGIDETSFNELFEDFVVESHTMLKRINKALEDSDIQSVKHEAVKFKGMSDNMRFKDFSHELETLIHTTDKDKIIQATEAIDAILKKISEIGA